MISREPTIERLAIARSLLLEPFGLDESHLGRALAEIQAHKVDDADLYFQYTRSEGWSLEEGIVKSGSSASTRASACARSAARRPLSPTPTTSPGLAAGRRAHRARDRGGGSRPRQGRPAQVAGSRSLYPGLDPIATLDSTAKVALLGTVESWPGPRTRAWPRSWPAWPANTTWCWWRVPTARWPPTCARWCACRVTVIAEHKGRREMGMPAAAGASGWPISTTR
jgi:TldD protein